MRLISDLDEVGDIVAVGTRKQWHEKIQSDAFQYSWVIMWKWNLDWLGMWQVSRFCFWLPKRYIHMRYININLLSSAKGSPLQQLLKTAQSLSRKIIQFKSLSFSRARTKGKQGHMRVERSEWMNFKWRLVKITSRLICPSRSRVMFCQLDVLDHFDVDSLLSEGQLLQALEARAIDSMDFPVDFSVDPPTISGIDVELASMFQAAKKLERELAGDAGEDKPKKEQLGWKCDKHVLAKIEMVDVKQELPEHRTALLPLSPQVNFEFSAQGKSRNLCGTGLCGWNLLLWRSYFKVGGLLRRVPNQISQRTIRIIPWVTASVRTVWKRRLPVLRSKRTG